MYVISLKFLPGSLHTGISASHSFFWSLLVKRLYIYIEIETSSSFHSTSDSWVSWLSHVRASSHVLSPPPHCDTDTQNTPHHNNPSGLCSHHQKTRVLLHPDNPHKFTFPADNRGRRSLLDYTPLILLSFDNQSGGKHSVQLC